MPVLLLNDAFLPPEHVRIKHTDGEHIVLTHDAKRCKGPVETLILESLSLHLNVAVV
jgi:hypothetical protein